MLNALYKSEFNIRHLTFDNYFECWHRGVMLCLHYASGRCGCTNVGM